MNTHNRHAPFQTILSSVPFKACYRSFACLEGKREDDELYSAPVYQQNSVSIHDPLDLNRFKWEPFSARNA